MLEFRFHAGDFASGCNPQQSWYFLNEINRCKSCDMSHPRKLLKV